GRPSPRRKGGTLRPDQSECTAGAPDPFPGSFSVVPQTPEDIVLDRCTPAPRLPSAASGASAPSRHVLSCTSRDHIRLVSISPPRHYAALHGGRSSPKAPRRTRPAVSSALRPLFAAPI